MLVARTRLEELQLRKLLDSIRKKDSNQVKKLVENGIPSLYDYLEEGPDGIGAVHLCAMMNDHVTLKYLLQSGASPDNQDAAGRTPAMIAASHGHLLTLNLFDSDAVSVNMKLKDNLGRGVLFYCLENTERHSQIVDICIRRGADTNNVDASGIPLLYEACKRADRLEGLCLKLLECGADPNCRVEVLEDTPLLAATAVGSTKVVRALMGAGARVDSANRRRVTAAHVAARFGHVAILQILAAHGAHLDAEDHHGNRPMHYAAMKGHEACIRFLSTRFSLGSLPNKQKLTPAAIALVRKKESLGDKAQRKSFAQALKAAKRAVKAETSDRKVKKEDLEIYDWLREFESDLLAKFQLADVTNSGTVDEETFLDVMELHGPSSADPDTLKRLFRVHAKEDGGAMRYAEFLQGRKFVHKSFLHSAFLSKDKKKKTKGGKGRGGRRGGKKGGKFKLAVPVCIRDEGPRQAKGAPPINYIQRLQPIFDWSRFNRDNQPAHPVLDDSYWYMKDPGPTYCNITSAARTGDFESLKRAINSGQVSVDQRDKYYKTPLMVASVGGHIEMVRFLMDMKADVNARDNFFWTPLHLACHSGQLPVVQLLVDAGADINALTMHKATPLHKAVETSRVEVVEFLLEKGVRLQQVNAQEQTAYDLALKWADPRVCSLLGNKYAVLPPPPKDDPSTKKKKQMDKKKGVEKPVTPLVPPAATAPVRRGDDPTEPLSVLDGLGAKSVVLAASAIATNIRYSKEDVTYRPGRWWVRMPDTQDLLRERQHLRGQHGWLHDFQAQFKMPYSRHAYDRANAAALNQHKSAAAK